MYRNDHPFGCRGGWVISAYALVFCLSMCTPLKEMQKCDALNLSVLFFLMHFSIVSFHYPLDKDQIIRVFYPSSTTWHCACVWTCLNSAALSLWHLRRRPWRGVHTKDALFRNFHFLRGHEACTPQKVRGQASRVGPFPRNDERKVREHGGGNYACKSLSFGSLDL